MTADPTTHAWLRLIEPLQEPLVDHAEQERGGLPPGFVLATKADRNLDTGAFVKPWQGCSLNWYSSPPLVAAFLRD